MDKSIPPEKCSKIDYGNLTLGLINLYKRAKVIFPLMSYLRLKGLTTVEIEEVNGLIWGLTEKKGILWKELPKHLSSLIKEIMNMSLSAGVQSALSQYLKDLKSDQL